MDSTTPTATKKLADLSFTERGKFLIEKYKLINGQKLDTLTAEEKTRATFGLAPLTEAEKTQLKDRTLVEKIVDSTPLQVIGASAIIHQTWNKYINGKVEQAKEFTTQKIESTKEAALTKADDLKEAAKEKAVNTTQSVIATVADKVGLKTETATDNSPEAAFLATPTEQPATPVAPVASQPEAIAVNPAPVIAVASTAPTPTPIVETLRTQPTLMETEAQKTAVFDRVPTETAAVAMSANAEM